MLIISRVDVEVTPENQRTHDRHLQDVGAL